MDDASGADPGDLVPLGRPSLLTSIAVFCEEGAGGDIRLLHLKRTSPSERREAAGWGEDGEALSIISGVQIAAEMLTAKTASRAAARYLKREGIGAFRTDSVAGRP